MKAIRHPNASTNFDAHFGHSHGISMLKTILVESVHWKTILLYSNVTFLPCSYRAPTVLNLANDCRARGRLFGECHLWIGKCFSLESSNTGLVPSS